MEFPTPTLSAHKHYTVTQQDIDTFYEVANSANTDVALDLHKFDAGLFAAMRIAYQRAFKNNTPWDAKFVRQQATVELVNDYLERESTLEWQWANHKGYLKLEFEHKSNLGKKITTEFYLTSPEGEGITVHKVRFMGGKRKVTGKVPISPTSSLLIDRVPGLLGKFLSATEALAVVEKNMDPRMVCRNLNFSFGDSVRIASADVNQVRNAINALPWPGVHPEPAAQPEAQAPAVAPAPAIAPSAFLVDILTGTQATLVDWPSLENPQQVTISNAKRKQPWQEVSVASLVHGSVVGGVFHFA